MILNILHFGIRLLGKIISYPLRRWRVNRTNILSEIPISHFLAITANVRKNYSNLCANNNCVLSKCKHMSSVQRQPEISNKKEEKKSKIPKLNEPQVEQIKQVSNKYT